ncbi:MAG: hypothetical protein ACRCTW_01320 [Lactococcus garvieae]
MIKIQKELKLQAAFIGVQAFEPFKAFKDTTIKRQQGPFNN